MASDWLVYMLLDPFGLMLIGAVLGLPFLLWRRLLGAGYVEVGVLPYVAGYLCALVGLVVLSYGMAHVDFSAEVARGQMAEVRRWATVPVWASTMGVILLIPVLPLLGLVGVPFAAICIRRQRLTWRNILIAVALLCVALTCLFCATPHNLYAKTHRLEWLVSILSGVVPAVLLILLPFLLGCRYVARRRMARPAAEVGDRLMATKE